MEGTIKETEVVTIKETREDIKEIQEVINQTEATVVAEITAKIIIMVIEAEVMIIKVAGGFKVQIEVFMVIKLLSCIIQVYYILKRPLICIQLASDFLVI